MLGENDKNYGLKRYTIYHLDTCLTQKKEENMCRKKWGLIQFRQSLAFATFNKKKNYTNFCKTRGAHMQNIEILSCMC